MVQDLHQAIADGKIEKVRDILNSGVDINGRKNFGCPTPNFDVTPLMVAVDIGNVEIVSLLLERNADPNLQDVGGWTALMRAVALGDKLIVQKLLAHGADAGCENDAGDTAINWASGEEIESMLKESLKPERA